MNKALEGGRFCLMKDYHRGSLAKNHQTNKIKNQPNNNLSKWPENEPVWAGGIELSWTNSCWLKSLATATKRTSLKVHLALILNLTGQRLFRILTQAMRWTVRIKIKTKTVIFLTTRKIFQTTCISKPPNTLKKPRQSTETNNIQRTTKPHPIPSPKTTRTKFSTK